MNRVLALVFALAPLPALACGAPVCLVNPEGLSLTRVITFDGTRHSFGPGHHVDDILPLDGARFGERFAGQSILRRDMHDAIGGVPLSPLTLLPGAKGQNFSIVSFRGNPMINGYGAAGFPKREAQGEGAIAVLFDRDQGALSFALRGGEAGTAAVQFFRRDGSIIGTVPIAPTGEFTLGFEREDGIADIAGFVLTNTDPQGLALDTLRFGRPPDVS